MISSTVKVPVLYNRFKVFLTKCYATFEQPEACAWDTSQMTESLIFLSTVRVVFE